MSLNSCAVAKFKTFCKWKDKDIEKRLDLLTRLVDDPQYVCTKCARVANTKKALCKAAPLSVKMKNLKSLSFA